MLLLGVRKVQARSLFHTHSTTALSEHLQRQKKNLYMKIKIIVLLALFVKLSLCEIYACGWFYTLDVNGKEVVKGHTENLHLFRHFSKEETLESLKSMEYVLPRDYNYKAHSNYALLLSQIGKVKEALEILERLNQEHPNEYILMANLGTLYELNGKNQEALHWIQKAIQKKPDSHYGSEWIHVKILEAKLNIQKDVNWLKNNHVIDVSRFKVKPLTENDLKELAKLEEHLNYQLHERVPYTPSPDPIVFQLLMDLGDLIMNNDLRSSHVAYSFAVIFAGEAQEKAQAQTKMMEAEFLISKYNKTYLNTTKYENTGNILQINDYQVINLFPKEVKKQSPKEQTNSYLDKKYSFLGYIMSIIAILAVAIFFIWRTWR